MSKNYKKWTSTKESLHNTKDARLFFHEREIWYCHLGENVGFEQDGIGDLFLRPIVIIRKFNNEIFWGVPLTRTHKSSQFYYSFNMHTEDGAVTELSTAILSQIRLVDAKRLRRMIGYIPEDDLASLKQKLKALMP